MLFSNLIIDTIQALRSATFAALTVSGDTLLNSLGLNGFTVASHAYGSAHADWTLSATEQKASYLDVSGADAGASIVALPTNGKRFVVRNASGYAITIKAAGQTGIVVANARTAEVRGNGTDFIRVTADQAH